MARGGNHAARLLPLLLSLAPIGTGGTAAESLPIYQERWRPQFHFTPPDTWMNDPNGMVYFDGEYHLFYQNNPYGNRWGHMSWGHAVSRDLVHWENLPLAIPEAEGVMIFSGSAVVDWNDTSGLGRDGRPPLVAIYTGHYTGRPLQNQHIAYSNDRGRTWTKYPGNPVLDLGEPDFRDPKVFWHTPTRRWVMAVSWPPKRKVRFYGSPDLKTWTHLSDFGPAGSTDGIWECPDLFPLPVEGKRGEQRWVLVVNVGSGAPAGGSGTQYFIGQFDGTQFVADTGSPISPAIPAGALWADWGPDFYASVSWSDVPARDGRRLWLGWMSNWTYANDVPTLPWRSAMTFPRELALRQTSDGLRLVQRPVREIASIESPRNRITHVEIDPASRWLASQRFAGGLSELELELESRPVSGSLTVSVHQGKAGVTQLIADFGRRSLTVDRSRSGLVDFSPQFPAVRTAPLLLDDDPLHLRLLVDVSSLEVFAQDGTLAMTSIVLPDSPDLRFSLDSVGSPVHILMKSLSVRALKPAPPIKSSHLP